VFSVNFFIDACAFDFFDMRGVVMSFISYSCHHISQWMESSELHLTIELEIMVVPPSAVRINFLIRFRIGYVSFYR
jgi:hypothetical protein